MLVVHHMLMAFELPVTVQVQFPWWFQYCSAHSLKLNSSKTEAAMRHSCCVHTTNHPSVTGQGLVAGNMIYHLEENTQCTFFCYQLSLLLQGKLNCLQYFWNLCHTTTLISPLMSQQLVANFQFHLAPVIGLKLTSVKTSILRHFHVWNTSFALTSSSQFNVD